MPAENGVLMQYFHWYNPADGSLWREVASRARELADAGITALWLPPAYKGTGGGGDVGYGVYDLYDLGEFEQKGSVRTKYGTRQEYLDAIAAAHAAGLQVYADVVLNHRLGGDEAETVNATPFPQHDRKHALGPPRPIKCYTRFRFPGRGGKYSAFTWDHSHFDAVDYDANHPHEHSTVYLLEGKQFDDKVSLEKGNFDYLMGCDLDFESPAVRDEVTAWGRWYLDTTGVDGLRLDAVKHISSWFFPPWLDALAQHRPSKPLFVVGEYWVADLGALRWYISATQGKVALFDVPLHYNFHRASQAGGHSDMRKLLDNSLMLADPTHAVTFVANHDSQPLQALESVIEPWFKPLAYAVILLRKEGYPCVFYPDYYGAEYEDRGRDGHVHRVVMPSHRWLIDRFLHARRHFAHGPQKEYFDHWNCVGWTRLGDEAHPRAMAVLMSDGPAGMKWMDVGRPNARFTDLTEHVKEAVTANADGWGEFRCDGGSVSVWVQDGHP